MTYLSWSGTLSIPLWIFLLFCFWLSLMPQKILSIQQSNAYTSSVFYLDYLSAMFNSPFLTWIQRNHILKGSRWLFPHLLVSSETCLCLKSKSHSQRDHRSSPRNLQIDRLTFFLMTIAQVLQTLTLPNDTEALAHWKELGPRVS